MGSKGLTFRLRLGLKERKSFTCDPVNCTFQHISGIKSYPDLQLFKSNVHTKTNWEDERKYRPKKVFDCEIFQYISVQQLAPVLLRQENNFICIPTSQILSCFSQF